MKLILQNKREMELETVDDVFATEYYDRAIIRNDEYQLAEYATLERAQEVCEQLIEAFENDAEEFEFE